MLLMSVFCGIKDLKLSIHKELVDEMIRYFEF